MKKFKTVFKYTYLLNIKSTSFKIVTIIGMILIGLSMNFNYIKEKAGGNSKEEIAVCDYDGVFALTEESLNDLGFDNCDFKIEDKSQLDNIKEEIKAGNSDYKYLITMYYNDNEEIEVFSKNNSSLNLIKNITATLKSLYTSNRFSQSDLDTNLLNNVLADVPVNIIELDVQNIGNILIAYISIFALYVVIMYYGAIVTNSVVEEKNNRIMETLITISKPIELFFGKVLGVCAVTLTQLSIFIGTGAGFMYFNEDIKSMIDEFNIDFKVEYIILFIVFIVLAYLLYAFIFAALGSLVSSTEDSTQAVMPLMIIVMAIMFAGIISLTNIESTFAVICSYIPFSSPIFMFARAVLTDISLIKVIISIVILIISTLFVGVFSSRVYKKGVLHYGKKASYFKMLLNKDIGFIEADENKNK